MRRAVKVEAMDTATKLEVTDTVTKLEVTGTAMTHHMAMLLLALDCF